MSLPSRGAWIEICSRSSGQPRPRVAPLAGSVDRNASSQNVNAPIMGRSPRGERG